MLPLNPAQLPALLKQAQGLHRAGRLANAAAAYRAVLAVAPGTAAARLGLAAILLRQGQAAAALPHLEAAPPTAPETLSLRAEALAALGQTDQALALYDRLIRALPKQVKPLADKALLLQRLGDFEGAETCLRRALRLAPLEGQLYRMLVVTRRITPNDPLIPAMLRAHGDRRVTGLSRAELGFALAKAMADTGQHAQMFTYLGPANAAVRAAQPHDPRQRSAEVEGLIAAFRGADFTPLPEGPDDIAPIFVTGLPRSGTTLVEQILASHSAVTAGGERRFGLACAYDLLGPPPDIAPLAGLSAAQVAGFGAAYAAAMRAAIRFDRVVTDKSIQTHLILGLVLRALPAARVIVVRRDPRDLGLSIYRNLFAPGTHRYAYDLGDIAGYIGSFERMMRFWAEVLPGRYHEISYDDLVQQPEPQARALLTAAGLEWEDTCLRFHEQRNAVATLSVAQVRQPIHAGSRAGWRRHEADLAPLIEGLTREGVL